MIRCPHKYVHDPKILMKTETEQLKRVFIMCVIFETLQNCVYVIITYT